MHPGNRFELCHPDARRDFFAENMEVIPRTTFCLKEASLSRKYSMQNNLENSAFFINNFSTILSTIGAYSVLSGMPASKNKTGEKTLPGCIKNIQLLTGLLHHLPVIIETYFGEPKGINIKPPFSFWRVHDNYIRDAH